MWAEPRQEFPDGSPDRRDEPCVGQVRTLVRGRLGREQGREHARKHERAHAEVGAAPADPVGQEQGAGAGREVADAPPDLRPGRQDRLLLRGPDAGDAPAVDDEVERGAGEAQGDREHDRPGEPMRRITERDAAERRHNAKLRDDDPGAAPPEDAPEQGRIVLVQERRPEELELVGEGQFAQEPDRGERDPGVGQPGRLRRIDEKERDAGREPETEGRRDPPIGEQRRPKGRRFRSRDGR